MAVVPVTIKGSVNDPIESILETLNSKGKYQFTENNIFGIEKYDDTHVTIWVD
jgi:hypothetical protein